MLQSIAPSRILDLKSRTFEDALKELLKKAPIPKSSPQLTDQLTQVFLEREEAITTCLGDRVALPHARVSMDVPYAIIVGRSAHGLAFQGKPEYDDLRLVVLLLVDDHEPSYLSLLGNLARVLQDPVPRQSLIAEVDLTTFKQRVQTHLGQSTPVLAPNPRARFNQMMFKHAEKVAEGADCSCIVFFADTMMPGSSFKPPVFKKFKTVCVTQKNSTPLEENPNLTYITVGAFNQGRLSQLRSAILLGLTRGVFKYNDRLCCLGGLPGTGEFDTLVVLDLEREFQAFFARTLDILPKSVHPEVVERLLAIASELAMEGREGRPIGALFVLGDTDHVKSFSKPLVINPFYGYKEEDRNILNPFMDETIKEFSSIDGAFIIRGDGVIESAGSFVHAPNHDYQIPSGLGTRHSAGAAISLATDCLAIVVSSSGRQITLFRRGQMLPLLDKGQSSAL
jgi:diadenylate cyclase